MSSSSDEFYGFRHLLLLLLDVAETVYHSSGVLSTLSSSWTSKPPLAVKYRLDTSALEATGGSKSLCSTLERLLAWEKKLYEEVKVIFSRKFCFIDQLYYIYFYHCLFFWPFDKVPVRGNFLCTPFFLTPVWISD